MSDATTKAFALQSLPKADRFKAKTPAIDAMTSAPTVNTADTLLKEMSIDVKNSTSNGNHLHIDFQGDFRPILMCLCFYAANFYDALDQKNHSKLSPPTLTAYFLFVIYSFYLLADLELRPTPSRHTRFMSTPEFIDLKRLLLDLPVPDFLIKFLLAAAPTADPRRPNITVSPSFACWSLNHDFGRYFPISIFFLAHNYVLSHKTNDAADTLLAGIMQLALTTDAGPIRIGNLFGQLLSDGTSFHSYGNQLYQAFESIIQPATARTRSNRNAYSKVTQFTPTIVPTSGSQDVNPYIWLMNLDEDNFTETETVIRQILGNVSSKLKITGKLGNVLSSLSGMNVLIHSYAPFACPTWHYTTITPAITPPTATISSAKQYAALLKFLARPERTPDTDLLYPTDDTTITKLLYLVKKGKKSTTTPEHYPADDDIETFDPKNDAAPAIRVLDPYDYNASSFHTVFLSGALLESRMIDGSAVPLPDTSLVLDEENTLYLQSALPYSRIIMGTHVTHNSTLLWAERRNTLDTGAQKAATLLYDLTENRLPQFDQNIRGAAPTELYGFHPREHISLWKSIFSKIGFKTPTTDNKSGDMPPLPATEYVLAWSPYRWFAGNVNSTTNDNYFMLMNLRTVYGTNPPLGEIAHFLRSLPVS